MYTVYVILSPVQHTRPTSQQWYMSDAATGPDDGAQLKQVSDAKRARGTHMVAATVADDGVQLKK
jgi:hypothetical protein